MKAWPLDLRILLEGGELEAAPAAAGPQAELAGDGGLLLRVVPRGGDEVPRPAEVTPGHLRNSSWQRWCVTAMSFSHGMPKSTETQVSASTHSSGSVYWSPTVASVRRAEAALKRFSGSRPSFWFQCGLFGGAALEHAAHGAVAHVLMDVHDGR